MQHYMNKTKNVISYPFLRECIVASQWGFCVPPVWAVVYVVTFAQTCKFCEHLKASNTMARFGSRLSNSCYFTPKRHQKQSRGDWNQKIFLGDMPADPPNGHASHALLCFTNQVHTGTPPFKILDLPLTVYRLCTKLVNLIKGWGIVKVCSWITAPYTSLCYTTFILQHSFTVFLTILHETHVRLANYPTLAIANVNKELRARLI